MNSISVTLAIWSDRLPPDRITQIMRVPPDRAVMKGSERTPPRPAPLRHGWYISEDRNQARAHVQESLDSMAVRLIPIKGRFAELRNADPDVSVTMIVTIAPEDKSKPMPVDEEVSLYADMNFVSLLAEIGAPLSLETFSYRTADSSSGANTPGLTG